MFSIGSSSLKPPLPNAANSFRSTFAGSHQFLISIFTDTSQLVGSISGLPVCQVDFRAPHQSSRSKSLAFPVVLFISKSTKYQHTKPVSPTSFSKTSYQPNCGWFPSVSQLHLQWLFQLDPPCGFWSHLLWNTVILFLFAATITFGLRLVY